MTRWLADTLMSGEPLIVPGLEPCDDENPEQPPPTDGERCAILGVPLSISGQIYGGLALFFGEGRTFSSEDVELGLTLVDQAALAIANAQLRERVEHIAAEAERSRLARDLHDAVTQTLFSASLIAEVLPGAWEADRDEGHQLLKELRLLSRGAMAEMRTLLMELRPAALIEAPLGDLLRQLAEAVTGRTGLPVEVTVRGKCTLPDDVHVAMYRIAQEALNNVMKHSHAQHVQVSLMSRGWRARTGSRPIQEVKLQVRDDGRGFDLQGIPPDRLGLNIIRERAQAIGATHRVESELGAGTTVTAVWKG